jgi:virginiamycin B lyase
MPEADALAAFMLSPSSFPRGTLQLVVGATDTRETGVIMSRLTRLLAVALVALPFTVPAPGSSLAAQGARSADTVQHSAWDVPWQGRPRDPYVAPAGDRVWFVGQSGNYVAFFTPANGQFRQIAIDSGTHPHTVVVDKQGNAWYAGNMNGMIGRIDGRSLAIRRYPMPEAAARDPHTIDFDSKGNLWFSLQNSNMMGQLDVTTGAVALIRMPTPRSRPYGVVVAPDNTVWFDLFGTNKIGMIAAGTKTVKEYVLPDERARPRRIARTSDGGIWYTDYSRGFLGRLDPASGAVKEWELPGKGASLPYAMAVDEQDRLWVVETGVRPNRLVGFDPKSQRFFGHTNIGKDAVNAVRHMVYDPATRALWYGSDQGQLGRAVVPRMLPVLQD